MYALTHVIDVGNQYPIIGLEAHFLEIRVQIKLRQDF